MPIIERKQPPANAPRHQIPAEFGSELSGRSPPTKAIFPRRPAELLGSGQNGHILAVSSDIWTPTSGPAKSRASDSFAGAQTLPNQWELWNGSIVPALRAQVAEFGSGRGLLAILGLTTKGRADLVIRIEENGELWSVLASWHRDRVATLEAGRIWADQLVQGWILEHRAEAERLALLSPEEAAFWGSHLREMRRSMEQPGSLGLTQDA